MARYHILHDKKGRYLGHSYGSFPIKPTSTKQYVRTLTDAEVDLVANQFYQYRYDTVNISKLKLVFFSVVPNSVYEIGVHNKISISVKEDYDTSNEDKQWLVGKTFNIRVNDQPVKIKYGEIAFLNPQTPGVYLIELDDERLYSKVNSYTVSVINSQ